MLSSLGRVLALVLAQETEERQDNMPQHLIHVRLADQVSLYNHQNYRPRFFDISHGTWRKPMFYPDIEILRKMA